MTTSTSVLGFVFIVFVAALNLHIVLPWKMSSSSVSVPQATTDASVAVVAASESRVAGASPHPPPSNDDCTFFSIAAKCSVVEKDDNESTTGDPSSPSPNANRTNDRHQRRGRRRPLLLLHVGPHKTATSSIQCHFSRNHGVMSRQANAAYSGRLYEQCLDDEDGKPKPLFNPRSLVRCLDRHATGKPCPGSSAWRSAEKVLDALADRGRDLVVVSDEAFSRLRAPEESAPLLRRLLSRRVRVRVVVGYRRYHAWVTSSHRHYVGGLLRQGKSPSGYSLRRAVVEGRSFSHDYDYFLREHPTEHLASLYGSVFPDVVVFDLHDDDHDHVMRRFFAHATRRDERALGLERTLVAMSEYEPKNPNTGNDENTLGVMTMARAAVKDGLVRKDVNEGAVMAAVAKRVRAKGKFPHLECLSSEEEEIFLNKSLAFEERVISRWATRNLTATELRKREDQHRKEFASANHCTVDVVKVIKDGKWRRFFRSL